MIVENDYSSALEHVIVKFDLKMSKGNSPEFLEHRLASHTGYSTRYIKVSEGVGKKSPFYEVILPLHMLGDEREEILRQIENAIETYDRMISRGMPKEAARYILPFAQAVGIYHVTMNLRSLLNLLSLRLCVRASPEFRCIASQLYFKLISRMPLMRGMVGCRGFMKGVCPESGVIGVRVGKQHPTYPPCPFKNPNSDIYIPTKEELRKGADVPFFDLQKAVKIQESLFKRWAEWK